MNRSRFLLVAGVMAAWFGALMMVAPGTMLANMARDATEARLVLQWMGVVLFSLGIINILARTDPASRSLRAIFIGNIVMHVIGFGFDLYHHALGFVQTSGVVMGGLVHGLLTAGFAYYLPRPPAR